MPAPRSISDAAVTKATGRSWARWFAVLDRFNVKRHGHAAAARHLASRHRCRPWWSQMVVVEYERARGLRAVHQTARGYVASASKTVAAPLPALYAAWRGKALAAWLPQAARRGFTVRRATRNKSMRINWIDGTPLEVNFYDKSGPGARKSQVAVQHSKLAGTAAVDKSKAFWKAALARMADRLAR